MRIEYRCEWYLLMFTHRLCSVFSIQFCQFFHFRFLFPSYFPICQFKMKLWSLHESIQTKSCVTKANEGNEFTYLTNVMYVVKSCFLLTTRRKWKTLPEKLCHHSLVQTSSRVTLVFYSFGRKIHLLSDFVGCWMPCKCPLWMHFKLIVYIRAEMNESNEIHSFGLPFVTPLRNSLLCAFIWNK